jgi:hypothetical protein
MRLRYLYLLVASSALLVHAGESIGSVSSVSPFRLDGAVVNSAGVQGWPLKADDTVVAGSTPIAIFLRDGSRINLAANASLHLESAGSTLSARLTEGSMQYSLASGSGVHVFQGSLALRANSGTVTAGSVGLSSNSAFPFSFFGDPGGEARRCFPRFPGFGGFLFFLEPISCR